MLLRIITDLLGLIYGHDNINEVRPVIRVIMFALLVLVIGLFYYVSYYSPTDIDI